jgi:hypothetical protein
LTGSMVVTAASVRMVLVMQASLGWIGSVLLRPRLVGVHD